MTGPRITAGRRVVGVAQRSADLVAAVVCGWWLARGERALWALLAGFFLWGMASQMFGAVQDVVPDREGGLASVATVLGARPTVWTAAALYAGAGLLMLGTQWPGPLAALLAVPYLGSTLRFAGITDATSGQANRGWRTFLWLNYLTGFLVTMLLIWWAFERGILG